MSSVPGFFSKDAFLRRQARLNRTRKNGTRPSSTKIRSTSMGSLLDHIPKEKLHSSPLAPIMPLSRLTTRARRRHALKVPPVGLGTALSDIAEEVVMFTDVRSSIPPLPTPPSLSRSPCKSPAPIPSSRSSSPDSQSSGLPLTPSTDEEFPLPSPPVTVNPRRVTVKPLVIHKSYRPSTLPIIDQSDESDSDDSDSEWYTREFSKILSLTSAAPPTSLPAAHRDSIAIPPNCDSPLSPSHRRRRKNSGASRYSMFDATGVTPTSPSLLSPRCRKTLSITGPRRPPPRTSIPDDACMGSAFSLAFYFDGLSDPGPSPLSMYSQESVSASMRTISEDDFEKIEFPEDFEVQVDCPMMLPLSLPGTPFDLESDIAQGLEELWMKVDDIVKSPKDTTTEERGLGIGFVLEEADEDNQPEQLQSAQVATAPIICTSPPLLPAVLAPPSSPPTIPLPPLPTSTVVPRPRRPVRPASLSLSTVSGFSFPPPPILCQDFPVDEIGREEDFDERKYGLKSRWSTSTLASLREDQSATMPRFPSTSKLRLYFQGQHKRSSSAFASPISPKFSIPSMSPTSLIAKAKEKIEDKKAKDQKGRSGRDSGSDILVIGYDNDLSRWSVDSHHPNGSRSFASIRRSYDY